MRRKRMAGFRVWGDSINDSGLTFGVHDETSLIVAVKVSFGVHSK